MVSSFVKKKKFMCLSRIFQVTEITLLILFVGINFDLNVNCLLSRFGSANSVMIAARMGVNHALLHKTAVGERAVFLRALLVKGLSS